MVFKKAKKASITANPYLIGIELGSGCRSLAELNGRIVVIGSETYRIRIYDGLIEIYAPSTGVRVPSAVASFCADGGYALSGDYMGVFPDGSSFGRFAFSVGGCAALAAGVAIGYRESGRFDRTRRRLIRPHFASR